MKVRLRLWLIVLASVFLLGCAKGRELPYDAWSLDFFAPPNMEVWVETANVEDIRGHFFYHAGGGTIAVGSNDNPPPGWPDDDAIGAGRYVDGADFPRRIYVRWQSLVEPQTYEVTLDIPQAVRDQMAQSVRESLYPGDKTGRYYYENLVIGLAPGGSVGVWVSGPGFKAIPMMCAQAKIVALGPSQGKTDGQYAYTFNQLDPSTQAYLKAHTIPYSSWKCDQPPFGTLKPKVIPG